MCRWAPPPPVQGEKLEPNSPAASAQGSWKVKWKLFCAASSLGETRMALSSSCLCQIALYSQDHLRLLACAVDGLEGGDPGEEASGKSKRGNRKSNINNNSDQPLSCAGERSVRFKHMSTHLVSQPQGAELRLAGICFLCLLRRASIGSRDLCHQLPFRVTATSAVCC